MENLNIKIDKSMFQKIVCDECSHDTFAVGLHLYKVSKFAAGTDKDALNPVQVFYCVNCRHINENFLPEIG